MHLSIVNATLVIDNFSDTDLTSHTINNDFFGNSSNVTLDRQAPNFTSTTFSGHHVVENSSAFPMVVYDLGSNCDFNQFTGIKIYYDNATAGMTTNVILRDSGTETLTCTYTNSSAISSPGTYTFNFSSGMTSNPSFDITSINRIDFQFNNAGSASDLRVSEIEAVPEPMSTLAMAHWSDRLYKKSS